MITLLIIAIAIQAFLAGATFTFCILQEERKFITCASTLTMLLVGLPMLIILLLVQLFTPYTKWSWER